MKKVKCSYSKEAFVSGEIIDNSPTLVIDFNINTYQVLGNGGWQEKHFPENIIINDKIYLNEELKDKILVMLDDFINNSALTLKEFTNKKTARGFSHYETLDIKGNCISIQESSNVTPAVWFGTSVEKEVYITNDKGELVNFELPKEEILISDRLHLREKNAVSLKKAMISEWDKIYNKKQKITKIKIK